MKYSNPTQYLVIPDYPIGGNHRGECVFSVEQNNRGYRAVRQTKDKNGKWNKPKAGTYGGKIAFVTGEDGRTYVLQEARQFRAVKVSRWDFMSAPDGYASADSDPQRYAELKALIEEAHVVAAP